ncbi:MAG: ABC transporter substrate-binding protein [Phaeodactylibacter sp.]|nr:ABC transporter substrate-binding protein [Phaeodactylibacter sp.]MCB9299465.1 ABC transporter substrate-binding protein [Lewinellaceae bacterium]
MKFLPPFSTLLLALLVVAFACKNEKPKQQAEADIVFDLNRPLNEAVIQLDAEPDRLNPVLSTSIYSRTIFNGVFMNLLFIDPVSLELVPQLAKARPTISPIRSGPYKGGLAYTFDIHEQAVWDDGSPVTAEDYIFTLKVVFNPKVSAPAYRAFLSFIKDVQAAPDNPKRFTVYTDQQYIIGEEAVGSTLPVLPAYHYDPEGLLGNIPLSTLTDEAAAEKLAAKDARLQQFAELFESPKYNREPEGIVGCGPYRLDSWETGQQIVLSKKENWWGEPLIAQYPALAAYPDKLTFRPITDPNTAITALKDGQTDAMGNVAPNRFGELKETEFIANRYNFYSPPSLVHTFIYTNTQNPKLSDKRVRKALAYAINVQEIIETVFYGYAEPSVSPVHPSSKYYNRNLSAIPYDPEKARALLAEAGWTDSNNNGIVDKVIDGELVEMNLNYKYTAGRDISQNTALLVQESAKRAGFNIELEPKEFPIISDDLKRRDFELVPWAKTISPTLWEPKQDFHSEGDNRTGFGNAETDALIDRIQVTIDEKERNKLYEELQAILFEEMPIIYILVPTSRIAIHKRFEVASTPMFPGFFPNQLKLKEAQ